MVNVPKLAQMAIKKAGEIAEATSLITYSRVVPGPYNSTTGLNYDAVTNYPNVEVVLTDTSEAEQRMLGPVDKLTQKVILAALDLPVVPARTDYITDADGLRWEILRIKKVPGGSIFLIYVGL